MDARQNMRDVLFLTALRAYFEKQGIEIEHTPGLLRHLRSLDDATFDAIISPAWRAASNRAGPKHTKTVKRPGGKFLSFNGGKE